MTKVVEALIKVRKEKETDRQDNGIPLLRFVLRCSGDGVSSIRALGVTKAVNCVCVCAEFGRVLVKNWSRKR